MSAGNGKSKSNKLGPDGLTDRQRAFVEAFTGDAGGNAAEAYRMAGYEPGADTEVNAIRAYTLLQRPHMQDAVAWYAARRGLDGENAKINLAEIARSSMNNFLSVDADGEPKLDFHRAVERGALGQIKKYKRTDRTDKDGFTTTTHEIEVHDRLPAVQTILKMNGLLSEKVDHTVKITDETDPLLSDPLLNKLANEYERRMASIAGGDGQSSN
jgi:hypothetical protein